MGEMAGASAMANQVVLTSGRVACEWDDLGRNCPWKPPDPPERGSMLRCLEQASAVGDVTVMPRAPGGGSSGILRVLRVPHE